MSHWAYELDPMGWPTPGLACITNSPICLVCQISSLTCQFSSLAKLCYLSELARWASIASFARPTWQRSRRQYRGVRNLSQPLRGYREARGHSMYAVPRPRRRATMWLEFVYLPIQSHAIELRCDWDQFVCSIMAMPQSYHVFGICIAKPTCHGRWCFRDARNHFIT